MSVDWDGFVKNIEESIDRQMPEEEIPRPKLFAYRNAAGYTDREIAIANEHYRQGAAFVLRGIRVTALLARSE